MNECRRTADRLAGYTDRSLPPAEQADVERHLSACPPCRDEAAQQSSAQAVLRAKASELRAEPLPPGLRSRCEALARQHAAAPAPRWWTPRLVRVALAMLVVVAAAVAIYLATGRSDALLAAQLTADHTACFRAHVAANAPSLDAAQVEERFAQDYGATVHVPPSSPAEGVQLVHARICLYGEGRVPHLLYTANGENVSLYVLQGAERRTADVAAFGHQSHIWTRDDTTFVLVSSAVGEASAAERYLIREAR